MINLFILPNAESESYSSRLDLSDGFLDNEGLFVLVKKKSGTPSVSSSCLALTFAGLGEALRYTKWLEHIIEAICYIYLSLWEPSRIDGYLDESWYDFSTVAISVYLEEEKREQINRKN